MADFFYVASGSLNLGKCGDYVLNVVYLRSIAFSIGDTAWLKYKAEKGILESIVIKKIRLVDFTYKGLGLAYILYVDTFNALYNDYDLIYYADAVAIAQDFLNRRRTIEETAECLK